MKFLTDTVINNTTARECPDELERENWRRLWWHVTPDDVNDGVRVPVAGVMMSVYWRAIKGRSSDEIIRTVMPHVECIRPAQHHCKTGLHYVTSTNSLTLWRPLLPYGYSYIKYPVPDRIKPLFVIFDIRALWRSRLSVRVTGCQKLLTTA